MFLWILGFCLNLVSILDFRIISIFQIYGGGSMDYFMSITHEIMKPSSMVAGFTNMQ